MHRREWLKGTTAAGVALLTSRWTLAARAATDLTSIFPSLADAVLTRARELGASFADLHLMQIDSESLFVREEMVQGVSASSSLGGSVRVLVDGAWGFAASDEITEARFLALVEAAVAMAKGQAGWRARPIVIESLPAHTPLSGRGGLDIARGSAQLRDAALVLDYHEDLEYSGALRPCHTYPLFLLSPIHHHFPPPRRCEPQIQETRA